MINIIKQKTSYLSFENRLYMTRGKEKKSELNLKKSISVDRIQQEYICKEILVIMECLKNKLLT